MTHHLTGSAAAVAAGGAPTATDADRRWLAATWRFVRAHLPEAPARVLELGCGPLGGFVPALRADGYAAVGVDPDAPHGDCYHRVGFEHHAVPEPVDAVVACTSLHHVDDLDAVLDHARDALAPGGAVVVVEWAHERFDGPTARWCFDRLPGTGEPGWLHRHRDAWKESGQDWESYLASWVDAEGLHRGGDVVAALLARFDRLLLEPAPYFFAELDGVTPADERAAIDTGTIRAAGIHFVGRAPGPRRDAPARG